MKRIGMIGFLILGFASTMYGSQTYWPQTFWHSLRTRSSLETENYDPALSHALKALEKDPLAPELQINLGNAYEGLGSFHKAKEAYGAAEKLSLNPEIHFQSRFNQAQVLAKDKKIEEALSYYQKALEIHPDSKEVKTNIELLMAASGGKGGSGESKDKEGEGGEGQSKNQEEPKKFDENPKTQPKQAQELSSGDVKKILEELKQQEQRIRGDYYKQGQRDQKQKSGEFKREKDW